MGDVAGPHARNHPQPLKHTEVDVGDIWQVEKGGAERKSYRSAVDTVMETGNTDERTRD
jgi:hypothetical protein